MNDDLIKRSDAIGACSYETIECYEARKAIRALPSADRPQEWIPCSERLPEKQTTVLYSLEGCVSVAFMTDRNYTGETVELHWEDLETGITIYPEAWMPLPEPWKGADDETD